MEQSRKARLQERMAKLNLREEDFEETFCRSGGPGGQNVNKTSTAVSLRHHPTGLAVRCEAERSQTQNRVRARELLLSKIEKHRMTLRLAERGALERNRRRNRKRPKRVQERLLRSKAKQSMKKSLRRRIDPE